MNSMFSCFDALGIEVLFGKTPTAAPSISVAFSSEKNDTSAEKTTIGKKLDGNGEFSGNAKTKNPRKIRLAPEFDGLNCFETLISY